MEWLAIGSWLVATALLAVAGAPLAAVVFERFPGRGAPFALHASLVVIGLVSFWVGHLRYGWVALAAALAVLVSLSAAAYRRGHRPSWPAVAEGYAVFVAGFALALAVRVTDHTIRAAGGEQWLHFGLLSAVERAETLPPEDMWWAGESVNYYYGGHVLVDQLSRLAMTEPRLAYNLGLAVVFGLAAAAAYGLVGAVVAGYGYDRGVGGVVGTAMLLLAGTLATPVRLLLARLPESVAVDHGWFAYRAVPSVDPPAEVVAEYASVSGWSWWFERRVVDGMLVETPLYSLVKADLHGHVTTIPFMVVLIAVAFAYYRTPAERRAHRWMLVLGVFPALAGLVGWMNTWSLPGAVGIAFLALAFAPAHPLSLFGERFEVDLSLADRRRVLRSEASRLLSSAVGAVVVGLIGVAWIAPFVLFQLPTNDGIGIVSERSPLGGHLLLWGGFFALFALFIAVALWRRYEHVEEPHRGVVVGLAAVGLAGLLIAAGFASLAVATPLLLLTWWLVRRRPSLGFIGVLIVGTLGLILAMELVHAEVWPPERERLNTTYKVSMQAMVFGLLASAAIVSVLLSERLPRPGRWPSPGDVGVVVVVLAVIVLLGTFPVLALGTEVGGHVTADHEVVHSVDALDGHERWYPLRMEPVSWLDDQAGTPVVLEAPGDDIYGYVSPASTFTGVPTVVGWAHQRGYRGVDTYEERRDAVDAMYHAEADGLPERIERFGVDLIWVGPAERDRYSHHLRDFGQYEWTTVAFDNGVVTVYRVDHDQLSAG